MTEDTAKIGPASSRNIVYEILKNQIMSLQIAPGTRLSENTLSAQMNTGRVQVREALAQLVEEGYIVVYPHRGTEITRIDFSRIQQAVYSHTVLEQAVIRELCGRELREEQYLQMDATMAEKTRDQERDEVLDFLMSEQQLHYLLAFFCGRAYIWNVFRTMDCDLMRVRYLLYRTYGSYVASFSLASMERPKVESRLLLSNIKRMDAEAACLICASYFNTILGSADSLRSLYPQYFA